MKITILYKSKKLFNISMQNDMSVKRLREIIEETHHIPPEKQTLTYNGRILENGKLLMQDYGVRNRSEVTLSLPLDYQPKFKIYVKVPGGHIIKCRVHKSDLVSKLKSSIENAAKIPVAMQALSYGSWLMEDNVQLGEYNLQHGSVVRVLRKPPPTQISEVGNQVSENQFSAKEEADSREDSGVGDLAPKPSPIRRLTATKIPESVKSEKFATSEAEVEKIEPTIKAVSPLPPPPPPLPPPPLPSPPLPNLSTGESLRLNLPDTEAYRNFRQALGDKMSAKKEDEPVNA